jgi:uncharacterized membrane protein YgcG
MSTQGPNTQTTSVSMLRPVVPQYATSVWASWADNWKIENVQPRNVRLGGVGAGFGFTGQQGFRDSVQQAGSLLSIPPLSVPPPPRLPDWPGFGDPPIPPSIPDPPEPPEPPADPDPPPVVPPPIFGDPVQSFPDIIFFPPIGTDPEPDPSSSSSSSSSGSSSSESSSSSSSSSGTASSSGAPSIT